MTRGSAPRKPRPHCLYIDPRGRSALWVGGFSWMAALLPWYWALRHRQLRMGLALLASTVVMLALEAAIPFRSLRVTLELPWLAIQAWLTGSRAREWLRNDLLRRGYLLVAQEPVSATLPPTAGAAADH